MVIAAFGTTMIVALPVSRGFFSRALQRNGARKSPAPLQQQTSSDGTESVRAHRARTRMSTRRGPVEPGAVPRNYYKRKTALYVAYEGSKYAGFQQNDGVLTVADVLEQALHRTGGIRESDLRTLSKVGWVVAARTDKGVSAASNCVSFKAAFPRQLEEPNVSEHGGDPTRPELSPNFAEFVSALNRELPPDVRVLGAAKPTSSFSAKDCCSGRRYEYLLPLSALLHGEDLSDFNEILRQFEGTHPFHNFTIGNEHRLPPPANAKRYITMSSCMGEPVAIVGADGRESRFVRILVQGQSFMLHQIRKMVALSVLVERDLVPRDAIQRAFDRQFLTNIPPAPAAGLFLDSLHFTAYNKRFSKDLSAEIEIESLESEREAFKRDQIYPSILHRSEEEDGMGIFFSTVANHPPIF